MGRTLPGFVYNCQGCGARLTGAGLSPETWALCPECGRPGLPPDISPDLLYARRFPATPRLAPVPGVWTPEPEIDPIPAPPPAWSKTRGIVIGGSMVLEGDSPPGTATSTAFPQVRPQVVGGNMVLDGDVAPGSYESPFPPSRAPSGLRPPIGIRRAFWLILFLIMLLLGIQRLNENRGSVAFETVVYGVVALFALYKFLRSDPA